MEDNKFVGVDVNHKLYGDGKIISVENIGADYFFVIDFNKNLAGKRKFNAKLSIINKSLTFANQEDEINLKSLFQDVLIENVQDDVLDSQNRDDIDCVIQELVDKIKNNKSVAIDLIKRYDDEQFENELCNSGFKYFENIMQGFKVREDSKFLIILMCAYIALKYYDGDLHSHIERLYRKYRPETQGNYSKQTIIHKGLYGSLGDYRKNVMYFEDNSYNAVPIILAGVPHYRLGDLFRISYDIYKKKLLFDEELLDSQIKEKVLESFQTLKNKDLINNADTIKGTNYLMSKYTQSCIYSGKCLDALVEIVSYCIRSIINHLTRPEDSFVIDAYYKEFYLKWVEEFEQDSKEKERLEKSRRMSRPYLYFYANEIHLHTGQFRVDDILDFSNVHIQILENDKIVEDNILTGVNDIVYNSEDVIGGYIIESQDYILKCSPINKLSYKIICDGKEVYSSKLKLHRKVLFFDGRGKEIRPGTEYNGSLFVITNKSNKYEYDENIREENKGRYFISSIDVNSNEIYRFDNEPYVFFKVNEPKVLGYQIPWVEFIDMESKKHLIYKDFSIIFQASCSKEDIYIEIDGENYSYGEENDIKYRIYLYSNDYAGNNVYFIKLFNLPAGYHTFKIFNSVTNRLIKNSEVKFVYDYFLDKKYIEKDDEKIKFELKSSFQSEVYNLDFEYGCSYKNLSCFVKGLGHGEMVIYPSTISYSIDGVKWHDLDYKFYLCDCDDFVNELYICGPDNLKSYYFDMNSAQQIKYLSLIQNKEDRSQYKLEISYLRTLNDALSAKVWFEYGNKRKYFTCWYNPYVNLNNCKCYYDEENDKHVFKVIYEGTSKLKVVIRETNTENVLYNGEISSGDLIELNASEISEDIRFLSLSLYGRKYMSLFNRYKDEPFMTFPKYSTSGINIMWIEKPSFVFNEGTGILECFYKTTNVDKMILSIKASENDDVILKDVLLNGSKRSIDLSKKIYNSYDIQLFVCDESGLQSKKAVTNIQNFKIKPTLMQKTVNISKFILVDGRDLLVKHCIRFKGFVDISGKNYYVGSILTNKDGFMCKLMDVYLSVKKVYNEKTQLYIHKMDENKNLVKLKIKGGIEVDSIEI